MQSRDAFWVSRKALRSLIAKNWNAEHVCAQLIKKHPEIFIALLDESDVLSQIQAIYSTPQNRNNKVAAIKLYRDLVPGTGLKEAKDAVEAWINSGELREVSSYEDPFDFDNGPD